MKLKYKFLNCVSKLINNKLIATLASSFVLLSPICRAMNPGYYNNDFLNFRENSALCRHLKYEFLDIQFKYFDERKIYIHLISKAYKWLEYCEEENDWMPSENVTEDVIQGLISYIQDYKYDGTFKPIIEILTLTVECILCGNLEKLVDFCNMGFDIQEFMSDPISMTFDNFKKCMINRLEKLSVALHN